MSKMWRHSWGFMAVMALIGMAGCAGQGSTPTAASSKSLYERVGGQKKITEIVDDFVPRALKDSRVNFTRKGTALEFAPTTENLDKLKRHMVQFLCVQSGGPQKYEGKDMKHSHAGMGITNAQFDALAVDLSKAMHKCKVAPKDEEDLLTEIEKTRADIVEKK